MITKTDAVNSIQIAYNKLVDSAITRSGKTRSELGFEMSRLVGIENFTNRFAEAQSEFDGFNADTVVKKHFRGLLLDAAPVNDFAG